MLVDLEEEQQKIFTKAIKLLKKYDKEKVTGYIYYFVVSEYNNEEISCEYDCCDNPKCREETLRELKKEIPDCVWLCQDNNNDYESINYCYQCYTALNDTLAWVEYEIEDIEEDDFKNGNLKESSFAFKLRVIFKSMPSCDYEISRYVQAHPEKLPEALRKQSEFVEKIVDLARKVIEYFEEKE